MRSYYCAIISLFTYPAVRKFFFLCAFTLLSALTLLCPKFFSCALLLFSKFFWGAHLPYCAIILLFAYLAARQIFFSCAVTCCDIISLFAYPAVRKFFFFFFSCAVTLLSALSLPCCVQNFSCALLLFSKIFFVCTYPAMPLSCFSLTLLCHYSALHLPCRVFFFFRLVYPDVPLDYFSSHLPCCALYFFGAYPAVQSSV